MQDFLKKAFEPVVSAHHSIMYAYEYAGYLSTRALMDNRFLSVDADKIPIPLLRKGVTFYEVAKQKVQSVALNQLELKIANGDVGPKPDIKPNLFRAANSLGQVIPRLALSHSAVVALTLSAAIVAGHLLTNGHFLQSAADITATILGGSPRGKGPMPKL